MREIVGYNHAVRRVTEVVVERTPDDAGVFRFGGDARVPVAQGRTAGLVALRAVDGEIGTGAPLEALRRVARRRVFHHPVRTRNRGAEIAGRAQGRDLVLRDAAVGCRPVQLRRVETECISAHRRVAVEARRARRKRPGLRLGYSTHHDVEGARVAALRHQIRIRLVRAPFVADAVNAVGGLDDKPSLEMTRRGRTATRGFDVEILHPDGAGGQRPVSRGRKRERRRQPGDGKPARLDRVVRPERDIRRIGDNARIRCQRGEAGKRAGRGECRRKRTGDGVDHQATDVAGADVARQNVTIGGIDAERDQGRFAGQLRDGIDAGHVVLLQRPDAAAALVAKNVGAVKLRQARPARDDAARDHVSHRVIVNPDGRNWIPDDASGGRARAGDVSLDVIPAIVASLHNDVDFLALVLADIADIKLAGGGIEAEAEWIAQAHGPKFRAHQRRRDGEPVEGRGAGEGIVGRDGVVGVARSGVDDDRGMRIGFERARFPVDVDSQNSREKILVDALAVVEGIIPSALITDRIVKITVGAEVNVAAIVIGRFVELAQ